MDSFILHTEDADMIKALPDKQRLLLYDSIFSFAESDGAIEAPKNAAVKIAYIAITRRIAADHERYKAKCATNKENGKKGGRPRSSGKKSGVKSTAKTTALSGAKSGVKSTAESGVESGAESVRYGNVPIATGAPSESRPRDEERHGIDFDNLPPME